MTTSNEEPWDELVEAVSEDGQGDSAARYGVCDRCWQVRSNTGECGCYSDEA